MLHGPSVSLCLLEATCQLVGDCFQELLVGQPPFLEASVNPTRRVAFICEHLHDAVDLEGCSPLGVLLLTLLLSADLEDRGRLCGVLYFGTLVCIRFFFIFLLGVRREFLIRATLQGGLSCFYSLKSLGRVL